MSNLPLLCPSCKAPGTIERIKTTAVTRSTSFDNDHKLVVTSSVPTPDTHEDVLYCDHCGVKSNERAVIAFNTEHYAQAPEVVLPRKNSVVYYVLSNIDRRHGSTRSELESLSGTSSSNTTKAIHYLSDQGIVSGPDDGGRWYLTDYGHACQDALLASLS